jgi:hypothetical protein
MTTGSALKTETVPIANSSDVVVVRQRVRAWALELKLSLVDQTKIVTAASELGRNTLEHGGGGHMEMSLVENGGETLCGDAWEMHRTPGRTVYIMADGLGHGPIAAEASQEALRAFRASAKHSPERILSEVHGALAKTRGAAVSVAEILHEQHILNYAGAGNIVAAIGLRGKTRSLVSMNGTVGHSIGRIQQFPYPWEKDSMLIMHSDGLGTRWNLENYPGLPSRHPALLAGVLFRDFSRKRDDATIIVSRI